MPARILPIFAMLRITCGCCTPFSRIMLYAAIRTFASLSDTKPVPCPLQPPQSQEPVVGSPTQQPQWYMDSPPELRRLGNACVTPFAAAAVGPEDPQDTMLPTPPHQVGAPAALAEAVTYLVSLGWKFTA